MSERISLGTRGSELALAQTHLVAEKLRAAWPDVAVEIVVIRTSGDESAKPLPIIDRRAGRKGMFTREIEKALLVRQIDLAVHSAKDLPSDRHPELEIGGVLPRANTDDVLIAKDDARLTTLPPGAVIATGSVRRQHQVRWKRPDLQVVDLRGNVPTRLRKLRENKDWSGIILARAGVERLGLQIAMETLPADIFVPAGGQGMIALQIRRDDEAMQHFVAAVNHEPTSICLRVEREFLRLLQGDCDSPVGVNAALAGSELTARCQVFARDEPLPRAATIRASQKSPEQIAADLYAMIEHPSERR